MSGLNLTTCFAFIVFATTADASAQRRCEGLFPKVAILQVTDIPLSDQLLGAKYQPLASTINPVLLKKHGFKTSADGTELIDLLAKDWAPKIGKLSTLRSKYLFQWGPKEDHVAMVKDGGIQADYMQTVLEAKAQASGKGFYVSTSPVDSSSYGPALTTFQPKRDMTILEIFAGNDALVIKESTAFAKRLQEIGVDAIRLQYYEQNWLAVINSTVLQNASRAPDEVPIELAQSKDLLSALLNPMVQSSQFLPQSFLNKLPEDNRIRRIIQNKPLSFSEVLDFHRIATDPEVDPIAKQTGMIPTVLEAVKRTSDFLATAKNTEEAVAALKLIRDAKLERNEEDLFLESPSHARENKRLSSTAKLYEAILDSYGVRTVAFKSEGKAAAEPVSLERMKETAVRFQKAEGSTGFERITSVERFLALGEKAYGLKQEFRGKSLLMTASTKNDAQTMEVNPRTLKVLRQNPLITITPTSEKPAVKGNSVVYIEYLTLEKTALFFPHLTPELKAEIQALLKLGSPVDHNDPTVEKLMAKALYEITKVMLLEPGKFRTEAPRGMKIQSPFDYYKLFVSVHPFKNGNGRMGRIYYQHIAKLFYGPYSKEALNLALYDVDLFTESDTIPSQMRVSTALRDWIRQSPDDKEFLLRSRWAVELYFRVFPETRPLFPEFSPLGDAG